MRVHFCGAAESVTGSCHLVRIDGEAGSAGANILLDCGQFQGSAVQEAANFAPFPFDPSSIDFLILSHAHIDHCGRIPLLVKRGFSGRIYCTDATADLLPIMLRDSAHIHEMEAEWKSRKAMRAGAPAVEPLFTGEDAEAALKYITPVLYGELVSPLDGVQFALNDAGHLLGSAIVELFVREGGTQRKLVFSGDLGASGRPLLNDPTIIKKADYVIMETTYGNRVHEDGDASLKALADIVAKTAARGGTVLIPSFAVGRTQELLYEFNKYVRQSGMADIMAGIKVYVDSPMAAAATEAFRGNVQDFDDEAKRRILSGDDPLDFPVLSFTRTTEESKALNFDNSPKIIISASGMCEAGRVRHHLKRYLWDRNASIVFVGYQAAGTLGRRIIEGADSVTLFGEEIAVKAQVHNLQGFSAHADRHGLLAWAKGFASPPKALFLVHGEADAKAAFAQELLDGTGIAATVIDRVCEVELAAGSVAGGGAGTATGEAYDGATYGGTYGGAAHDGAAGQSANAGFAAYAGGGAKAHPEPIDPDDVALLSRRLRNINENLEGLLYDAKLRLSGAAAGQDSGLSDRYAALKTVIASLEKDTIRLAGTLAEPAAIEGKRAEPDGADGGTGAPGPASIDGKGAGPADAGAAGEAPSGDRI